ncbi:BrnT family toxin [Treponema sp. R6D11]
MLGADDVIYKNRYVWDRYKNDLNQRKHHLSFETASLVFDDPFYIEEFDEENSVAEERFNVTGSVTGLINNALVTVSVVYRGDLIRIFSARDADTLEVRDYYEQLQGYLNEQDED